jgi:dipeptide/tripeptide permease
MDATSDIDPSDGRAESDAERSDRNWTDILQELRVTQTGTQIISGFLLTVAFQQRFTSLPQYELVIYGVLVALAAVSTFLGLSAVSLHRTQFRRHDKSQVVSVASRLLAITVWVVAILAAGVVLFIFDFVFTLAAGLIAAVLALVAILVFIVLIPRSPQLKAESSVPPPPPR